MEQPTYVYRVVTIVLSTGGLSIHARLIVVFN